MTSVGGGPEKTILNSPRYLRELGYESICAYLHPAHDPGFESLIRRAAEADAQIVSIPDRGPFDLRSLRALISLCRDNHVAIWHGHDYKTDVLGLLVRRYHPMKLVTTVHGWGVKATSRTKIYNWVDQRCLRYYDEVICVSEELQRECLAHGVDSSHCHLVHNAIDTLHFSRRESLVELPSPRGTRPESFLLGAMGRLSGEKGFDLLIQATATLAQQGHDLVLWIAGEGPARSDLENLIHARRSC